MAYLQRLLVSCLALGLPLVSALAFPGAVGFGSIATGGTTPFVVTSLADSGTGTFRDAVSVSGRNITFAVSGYIVLESPVSLSSDITINGQTAPSPGIAVMGREVSASSKTNIIIRNFRMRQGNLDTDTGKSAFNIGDFDQFADTGGFFSHDIINNYFIAGPSTTSAGDDYFQMNANQEVFASGNFLDSNKDGVLNGAAANTVGSALVLSAPWNSGSTALATLTAAQAFTSVVASAGASPRDQVDAFVVATVQSLGTSGAIITNQVQPF
ncbi:Polysaccharide lyase family 1 protein [Mycena sanguinolenta]|uniref:Polysaccharide lyase family 1 protein n=1 Tax=Mycena sanguinolenta TaxID=230812 RepID=A0A8H6Y9V0_9AGAR|nr:Polysaccharide lyase family 1 protein [Mycena sanguinolenta]